MTQAIDNNAINEITKKLRILNKKKYSEHLRNKLFSMYKKDFVPISSNQVEKREEEKLSFSSLDNSKTEVFE